MKLYHVTPAINIDGIMQHGINPAYSTGKRRVAWFHTQSRQAWALLHISRHQRHDVNKMLLLTVEIPRSYLTRRRFGIWTTDKPITPDRIKNICFGIERINHES